MFDLGSHLVRKGQEYSLPCAPDRLRMIATLSIPVKDAIGTYLLVIYPDYSGAESLDDGFREAGEWTPPYVSYDVAALTKNFPRKLSTKTGELYKRFEEASAQVDLEADLYAYAERLGLSAMNIEPEPEGEVCHYRRAFRDPEHFRGYCIKKYLGRVSDGDFLNVADPEMRKGFAFLPIDGDFSLTQKRFCETHERDERLFLGKPIAVNLASDLEDQRIRDTLCNKATEIPKDSFTNKQEGFIFAGDLAGYGAFCEFVKNNTGYLETNGNEAAESVRDSAIHSFTRMFRRSGIYQTHTSGDGFICVVSASEANADDIRLREFLNHYAEMTERLDEINESLARPELEKSRDSIPELGSRLAIHFGEYRFGKMSMFASLLPSFDGSGIIEAARLEAGLRGWVIESGKPAQHRIIVSDAARAHLSDLNNLLPVTHEEDATVADKEFRAAAQVWRVNR